MVNKSRLETRETFKNWTLTWLKAVIRCPLTWETRSQKDQGRLKQLQSVGFLFGPSKQETVPQTKMSGEQWARRSVKCARPGVVVGRRIGNNRRLGRGMVEVG